VATEREFVAQPLATAGGRVIVSPFQFQTTGEDNLRISGWASLSDVVLVVHGRRFDDEGRQHTFGHRVPLSGDRLVTTLDFALGSGYLVNMVAFTEGTAPKMGQVFASVKLIRGLSGATILVGALLQGYLTPVQVLAWPGSPLVNSHDGAGAVRVVSGTNPAAGSEISETVPTGARWLLTALAFTLVTDATVALRQPTLLYDGGSATDFFRSGSPGSQTASQTNSYQFAGGMPLATLVGTIAVLAGLPDAHVLLPGHRFRTATANLQAGDDYATPIYVVREWLEVD
jgi:hypothetical protein